MKLLRRNNLALQESENLIDYIVALQNEVFSQMVVVENKASEILKKNNF